LKLHIKEEIFYLKSKLRLLTFQSILVQSIVVKSLNFYQFISIHFFDQSTLFLLLIRLISIRFSSIYFNSIHFTFQCNQSLNSKRLKNSSRGPTPQTTVWLQEFSPGLFFQLSVFSWIEKGIKKHKILML